MIVVVCVDNKMGNMFNGRRQSSDIKVLEHIVNGIGQSGRVFMSSYSHELFKDIPEFRHIVSDKMFDLARKYDICFVEGQNIKGYEDKVTGVILYKWNRDYPSDVKFDFDLTDFKLKHVEEFKGKSHEKITEEIYVK